MVAVEGIGCSSPALERLEARPAEASKLINGAVNTHMQCPATPLPAWKSYIPALESAKTLGGFKVELENEKRSRKRKGQVGHR